jgi:carbohydrate kinase (thermoresistant glucokinase family)
MSASGAPAIVVMGVAGCGKSTVGTALARALGARFLDGDDFHPRANVEKMAAGTPLTDADRWPWLDRLAAEIAAARDRGRATVTACSALRRVYRDRLAARGPVRFVHLSGDFELIAGRMAARAGHFMPRALLESQFATLEPLAPDEPGLTLDVDAPVADLVARIGAALPGAQ